MKPIEEAARETVRKEYLCESCAWKNDCNFCGGENTAFDCCECPADSFEDGFKAGANYIMSLPLGARMTDEERGHVRDFYFRKEYTENGKKKESIKKYRMDEKLREDLFGKEGVER